MDIKTGLSIYNKPWLIQSQAAALMLDYWFKVRGSSDTKWVKNESGRPLIVMQDPRCVTAPDNCYDEFTGFEGATVAVIPVTGPLMKNDFCGYYGTASLAELVKLADSTASVQKIVLLIDSPGGSADGNEHFAKVIGACKKETIGLVYGMACSAAYWIGSACNKFYASSQTDLIGCIGTMTELVDDSEALKLEGIVIREYHSTDSPEKNAEWNDAIKGNGKKLIQRILNPMNDVFLTAVKDNRKNINAEALDGRTCVTAEAISYGMVDGITTLERIISNTNKTKSNNMTLAELKAQHPDLCTQISTEAVSKENDRVGAWLVFQDVDPVAVKAGIESGKDVSQKQAMEFMQKSYSQTAQRNVEEDGKENQGITTPAAKPENVAGQEQLEAFKKETKANAKQLLQIA